MFPIHSDSKIDGEFIIANAETQGWRSKMEDFIMNTKVSGLKGYVDDILGVFDGHGGYYVSLVCKIAFPRVMEHNLKLISKREDMKD